MSVCKRGHQRIGRVCFECRRLRGRKASRLSRLRNPEAVRRWHFNSGSKPKARYAALLRRAKKAKLSCTLTFEQYAAIIAQPCVYGGKIGRAVGLGIDQKAPGLGYTLENSLSCCCYHNNMKGSLLSYDDMLALMQVRPNLTQCIFSIKEYPV